MTSSLASLKPNAALSRNAVRGNLNIQFGQAEKLTVPLVSDEWQMGGRVIQFVQLGPDMQLGLDQSRGAILIKVVTGALARPVRQPFCEPRGLQNTEVTDTEITAGPNGALLAIFIVPKDAPHTISSMDQLAFSGPQAGALHWATFEEKFSAFTDFFNGADAYIGPGFHLLDETGEEICFLNLWTAGKGVNLSTHNHGQPPSSLAPAFVETHLTLFNGTGKGGMFLADEPGAPLRDRLTVPPGHEHGPFFDFDKRTGAPKMRDNGAVSYPWHGWEAGDDDKAGQAYDVVAAFETAPKYANVQL